MRGQQNIYTIFTKKGFFLNVYLYVIYKPREQVDVAINAFNGLSWMRKKILPRHCHKAYPDRNRTV